MEEGSSGEAMGSLIEDGGPVVLE
jgi:hypothetical protein